MAKSMSRPKDIPVPPSSLWDGPMAWVGTPARPVECYGVEFPQNAVFLRGEVRLTIGETIGPGMTRQTERRFPGLIQLVRGTPAEVHLTGPDGQCWTFRRSEAGKRARWPLFAGATFPAMREVAYGSIGLERIVVQSVLPMAGTGRYVSFALDDEARCEVFSTAVDPDPND